MIQSTFGFFLLGVGLAAIALQRFYSSVPAHELKRLAARGDHLARSLYGPVAYGTQLRLLLWTVAGVSISVGAVLLTYGLPWWAAIAVLGLGLALGLVVVPSLRLTVRTVKIAATVAPAVAWVLAHVHPVLRRVADIAGRHRELQRHSGIYEKEDVLALLEQQKTQADSRLSHHELEIIKRALTFQDVKASKVLTSRGKSVLVNATDDVGPILLADLHKSKVNSFLVYDGSHENIIGTLFLHDAVHAKKGGKVGDVMRKDICYVRDDFSLKQVAHALLTTGQQLAVVINNFGEFVGTITFGTVMDALVGVVAEDNFDAYDDKVAVANYDPKTEQATEEAPEAATDEPAVQGAPSPEATEVVE